MGCICTGSGRWGGLAQVGSGGFQGAAVVRGNIPAVFGWCGSVGVIGARPDDGLHSWVWVSCCPKWRKYLWVLFSSEGQRRAGAASAITGPFSHKAIYGGLLCWVSGLTGFPEGARSRTAASWASWRTQPEGDPTQNPPEGVWTPSGWRNAPGSHRKSWRV